ncbi:MAG TPA: MBL fold metallo-hydrolase, partial [Steroidobacteraceae bacterium]|nr:MBL fold metallo-hydrolase [Steroidobacteraceae bacterium]
FLGPKRFQPVPVALRELPPLDAVIVSHDHYDHLDYTTMRLLRKASVPIITSLGVGAHLEAFGIAPERIVELDWWESHRVPGTDLMLTAGPSQHFSGRGLNDGNKTLWSSFVIQSQRHRVFFSGDTGPTPEHSQIRERLGPFDLVMLEVGAWHPAWGNIHLGPANALAAHALLGGSPLLPLHWGTFNLALHAWDEPVETLLQLAPRTDARLIIPRLGEPVEPAQEFALTPWWRGVDVNVHKARRDGGTRMPKAMPFPPD